jgi:hypothetical protein
MGRQKRKARFSGVAIDIALERTLIHEEISLLTVLYFPFRAGTPMVDGWTSSLKA